MLAASGSSICSSRRWAPFLVKAWDKSTSNCRRSPRSSYVIVGLAPCGTDRYGSEPDPPLSKCFYTRNFYGVLSRRKYPEREYDPSKDGNSSSSSFMFRNSAPDLISILSWIQRRLSSSFVNYPVSTSSGICSPQLQA